MRKRGGDCGEMREILPQNAGGLATMEPAPYTGQVLTLNGAGSNNIKVAMIAVLKNVPMGDIFFQWMLHGGGGGERLFRPRNCRRGRLLEGPLNIGRRLIQEIR